MSHTYFTRNMKRQINITQIPRGVTTLRTRTRRENFKFGTVFLFYFRLMNGTMQE